MSRDQLSSQSSMMTMWCFELRRISEGSTYSARNIRTTIRAKVTRIIVTTLLDTYLDHDDQNENDNDDEMLLSTVAIAEPDGSPSSFSAAKVSGGLKYKTNKQTNMMIIDHDYPIIYLRLKTVSFGRQGNNHLYGKESQQPSHSKSIECAKSFENY